MSEVGASKPPKRDPDGTAYPAADTVSLRLREFPDREFLFELAGNLQRWPVRNMVVRSALDRAALEVARLASEASAE